MSSHSLSHRWDKRISNESSFKLNNLCTTRLLLFNIVLVNSGSQLRKIFSSIALTCNEKISVSIFGIFGKDEIFKEFEHVIGYLLHCRGQWIAIRETCTNWLIYKNHINTLVNPRSLAIAWQMNLEISWSRTVSWNTKWSILGEETEHRGGTWASIEPEDKRSVGVCFCTLEQPVKKIVIAAWLRVSWKCARIHTRFGISGIPEW